MQDYKDLLNCNITTPSKQNFGGHKEDKYVAMSFASHIVGKIVSTQKDVSVPAVNNMLVEIYNNILKEIGDDDVKSLSGESMNVSSTVQPDYIICLEDGVKLKMLKRHLQSKYGMTIEDYKQKWKLPIDYPTVAPNYAKKRSMIAKKVKNKQ